MIRRAPTKISLTTDDVKNYDLQYKIRKGEMSIPENVDSQLLTPKKTPKKSKPKGVEAEVMLYQDQDRDAVQPQSQGIDVLEDDPRTGQAQAPIQTQAQNQNQNQQDVVQRQAEERLRRAREQRIGVTR